MAKLATNIDLLISGMRVGRRDPDNPTIAAVGEDKAFFSKPPSYEIQPKILKKRPDMAGGFKIPEEIMKNRNSNNQRMDTDGTEEYELQDESNIITKDEIIKELNLASGAHPSGEAEGSFTKKGLANDLVDSITKELEKLRRQSENIQTRKNYFTNEIVEEPTEEERNLEIKNGLEDMGCNVIHAEEERVQAQRHQTGQLGGLGAITLEEVLEVRKQTEAKLKDLELKYYQDKDRLYISEIMRKKLQGYNSEEIDRKREMLMREKDKEYYALEEKANAILKEKEFRASAYNPERTWVRRIAPYKEKDGEEVDEAKLLTKSKKSFDKPPTEEEIKRMLYEAKFAKYRVNRKLKEEYDSGKKKTEDFDLYLKGKESVHAKAKKINWDDLFAQKLRPEKYSTDYAVYQSDFDLKMLNIIRKKLEQLSKEDKLVFSILKWIFNALKKKDGYIYRKELVDQLDQNIDILQSLGFESIEDVSHSLGQLRTAKTGKLSWEEFLDFFGSRTESYRKKTGEPWWKTEQEGRELYIPINEQKPAKVDSRSRTEQLNSQAYVRMKTKPDGSTVFEENPDDPQTEAKMRKLTEARVSKLIVEDIEKELQALKGSQRNRTSSPSKADKFRTTATIGGLVRSSHPEIFRSGPECLLQNSHMELLHEIFNLTDKYNDGIVKITDLINNIKESKDIQLNEEAIKLRPGHTKSDHSAGMTDTGAMTKSQKPVILTIEDTLKDLHRAPYIHDEESDDERYKHKEYITWDEFVDFFEDYKTPEDVILQNKDKTRNRIEFKTDREKKAEMQKQIEEEKDRRLENLPRFRDDDIIDADEKYLDIVYNVFDSCVRSKDNQNAIEALEFYLKLKKTSEVVKINGTIAREPSGKSKIATETFSEVFYRMEKEHQERYIDWPTILEYFTKRGRPLTQEEIEIRKQQDYDEEDEFEREQQEIKDREDKFYNDLDNEHSQLSSPRRTREFEIPEGRDDIEDMEVVSSARGGFRSTIQSKKKVSFKDTFNDGSSTFDRPQTASGRITKSLKEEVVTGKDYTNHRRANKKRKGKSNERRITVPKPFKFDTRDKIRPKSIRERKVDEMIEEKKIKEENLLQHIFRAKQPHKDIITPKYNQIMQKNENRRKQVKDNSSKILLERQKPFSFYERDIEKKEAKKNQDPYMNEEFLKPVFKAKEVPDTTYGKSYKERQKIQDEEREIRVNRRKQKNLVASKLPPRMELHERQRREQEERYSEQGKKEDLSRFGTFEPPKAKQIPDFDRLQRAFQDGLDRKKTSAKLTTPEPFKFENELNRKKGSKTKASLRTFMDEENDPRGFNRSSTRKPGYIPNHSKPAVNPKSTKKQAGLEERRRKELEQKMKTELQTINENKERYMKQNKLKALDNTHEKKKTRVLDLQHKILGMKKDDKNNREKIKETVEKGRNNPLLIERYQADNEARKRELDGLNAIRMVRDSMVKNNLNPQKHLNDDQLDQLADADFLDKHKKGK
ncbi:unnamed protein product [Moneuplotes crassus]|uniref:EF-hand domain-containing protein n=1 Tax=Euplotes crassus TaxID=5936 RepID=A0AAD1U6V2_EUPCR|nr:unnamed protein product [Moneuplotes crassus]